MTAARDFSELVELLSLEKLAYELLLSMSEGQAGVFEKKGARGLMKVIAKKQGTISGLRLVDRRLSGYTRNWQATLAALPAAARAEIGDLVSEIGALVHRLLESERALQRTVEDARGLAGHRIREVSEGLAAVKAYGGAPAAAGRYLDREG
jgi:nicotinate-nucleotide pyrophosphorylase